MNMKRLLSLAVVGLTSLWAASLPGAARAQEPPKVQIPQPGVPQIMTMEGRYVRAAYNNEGYAILGYRLANQSVGEEWMLLEVGVTLRDGVPDYDLKRDALSLETPDGKTIPLASVEEYRKANLSALREPGEGPARLDQLLPAERAPGVPHRLLRRAGPARAGLGRGRAQQPARLPRPALLPGAGRDHVRPALAQREVREERRAGAVPDPDQGRGQAAGQELQGHQEAGRRGLQRRRRADDLATPDPSGPPTAWRESDS